MRLRLAVHRNGLPPAHILWNTDGLRPNHHTSSSHTTVAQFLDQVNEVVPLESEEWGLDDYVVEVDGFECVHFSVLNEILKNEDHVTIRPLQHSDRRILRVSGRHQISADGKHLIDGVAFGRPFLRRTDRPPVRIPSVKRQRLEYDQVDSIGVQVDGTNQLVLRENSHDESDNEIHDTELKELEDADGGSMVSYPEHPDRSQGSLRLENGRRHSHRLAVPRKRRRTGLGIEVTSRPSIPQIRYGSGYHARRDTSGRGSKSPSRISSRSSTKSVRFDGDALETPATVLAGEESEDEDEDFNPEAADSDSSESNKENVDPASEDPQEKWDSTSSSAQSSSDSSESASESDSETSSSGSDSSSCPSSTTASQSSSASTSVSKSMKEFPQSQAPVSAPELVTNVQISTTFPRDKDVATHPEVAPNQGKRRTQKRNQRRRESQRRKKLEAAGITLDPTGVNRDTRSENGGMLANQEESEADSLETKKLSLLQAIVPDQDQHEASTDALPSQAADMSKEPHAEDISCHKRPAQLAQLKGPKNLQNQVERGIPATQSQIVNEQSPEITGQTRRSRLDTASTKRLIFGSLGLRTPKSTQEEDALKTKLDANIRAPTWLPQQNGLVESRTQFEGDESWRDKIVLKAVECCYDGVELSTPPFPFVQRWDPQQQGRYGNFHSKESGGQSKRRKRNNSQYYQEYKGFDDYDYDQENNWEYESTNRVDGGPERSIDINGTTLFEKGQDASVMDPLLSPSEGDSTQAAINQQILQDTSSFPTASKASKGLDLLELPSDLSRCETLTASSAKPGAIIAFKQMEMSEETNWCPVISPYRTAKVDEAFEDGTVGLLLASRDVPSRVKKYDPETGERVYNKFDMPSDEEDEEGDESRLELSLLDMIEPKLVQPAGTLENRETDYGALQSGCGAEDEETAKEVQEAEDAEEAEEEHNIISGVLAANDTQAEEDPMPPSAQLGIEMSESARREYSLLMKDAGFHSEIAPDVSEGLGGGAEAVSKKVDRAEPAGLDSELGTDGVHDNGAMVPTLGTESDIYMPFSDPPIDSSDVHQPLSQQIEGAWEVPESEADREASLPSSPPTRYRPTTDGEHVGKAADNKSSPPIPYTPASNGESLGMAAGNVPEHAGASNDPDTFSISDEHVDVKFSPSASPVVLKSPRKRSDPRRKARSPSFDDSSSLPSISFVLSQPVPRSQKITDEAWDADYLPPSIASIKTEKGNRKARKSSARPNRSLSPQIKISSSRATPDRTFSSTAPTKAEQKKQSQHVDLTLSSNVDEDSGGRDVEDESFGSGSGTLPKGPGWVSKKSFRGRFARRGRSGGDRLRSVV